MNILVNQPFGIGDIIFCQTLANDWIKQGHNVTWPVFPQFVEQCSRAYPNIKFVNWEDIHVNYNRMDEHDDKGYRVVPLRFSVELANVEYKDCMRSKYSMFNEDFNRWKEGAMWQRDEAGEHNLYNVAFSCYNGPYALVNNTFGSDMSLKVDIPKIEGMRTIEMRHIENYSLFDWAKVIENATEIHTVSTSIIYLLEMLDLKAKVVHLYARTFKSQGFDNIDYILQKHKYIFYD